MESWNPNNGSEIDSDLVLGLSMVFRWIFSGADVGVADIATARLCLSQWP